MAAIVEESRWRVEVDEWVAVAEWRSGECTRWWGRIDPARLSMHVEGRERGESEIWSEAEHATFPRPATDSRSCIRIHSTHGRQGHNGRSITRLSHFHTRYYLPALSSPKFGPQTKARQGVRDPFARRRLAHRQSRRSRSVERRRVEESCRVGDAVGNFERREGKGGLGGVMWRGRGGDLRR